jgi:hypothetical protein
MFKEGFLIAYELGKDVIVGIILGHLSTRWGITPWIGAIAAIAYFSYSCHKGNLFHHQFLGIFSIVAFLLGVGISCYY